MGNTPLLSMMRAPSHQEPLTTIHQQSTLLWTTMSWNTTMPILSLIMMPSQYLPTQWPTTGERFTTGPPQPPFPSPPTTTLLMRLATPRTTTLAQRLATTDLTSTTSEQAAAYPLSCPALSNLYFAH